MLSCSLVFVVTVASCDVVERELPAGARLHSLQKSSDHTGSRLDLYDPAWGLHEDSLVYAHVFTILPGCAKGWGLLEEHDDRYALLRGTIEIALYDAREQASSFGLGVRVVIEDSHRQLLIIPRGVWHASRNIGECEALIADFPTRPYRHENPDKFTLPLDTPEIPYQLGPEWCGF